MHLLLNKPVSGAQGLVVIMQLRSCTPELFIAGYAG
jgi:hypothetical protein